MMNKYYKADMPGGRIPRNYTEFTESIFSASCIKLSDCSRSKPRPARKMQNTTQKRGQKMPVLHSSPGTTSQGKLRWVHCEAQNGTELWPVQCTSTFICQYTWLLPGQSVHVVGLVKAQQTLRARDDPNGIQAPQQSEGCWRSIKICLQSVCPMALYGSLRYYRRTIFWTTASEITQDCKEFANKIQTATEARCHKYQDLK